jgi:hypothetical protein
MICSIRICPSFDDSTTGIVLAGRAYARKDIKRPQRCDPLNSGFQLFADDLAQHILQGLVSIPYMLAQRFVDQCLVVAASCVMHLLAKPIQHIRVNPNRNPGFARRRSCYCPLFRSLEIILFFCSYALLSLLVAFRADIKRIIPPRYV